MTTCLFAAALIAASHPCASDPAACPKGVDREAVVAVERFADAWEKTQSITYRLRKIERLRDGEQILEVVNVKFMAPGYVYLGAILPRQGQEVIYNPERSRSELTAHPGHFPDFTLNLDILGSLATKNQHHPITHTGFAYSVKNLSRALKMEDAAKHGGQLRSLGDTTFAGRPATKVVLHAGNRKPRRVAAKKDETLYAFAKRVGMDAYVIYCANPRIESIRDELEAGLEYVVPPYYAAKIEVLFDKETGLPLAQSMWDNKGNLYERYEHHELKVNPALSRVDFDPDNPTYNF